MVYNISARRPRIQFKYQLTVTDKQNFHRHPLLPQGPSLNSANILYVVVQTTGVLLVICTVLYSLQTVHTSQGPRTLQLTERASLSVLCQHGSRLPFPT